jgi:hypothetical protein
MLAEASRVQVGDTEASVLPLVRKYSGYRWTTEPLPPREQWLDKDEYEYRKELASDRQYEFGTGMYFATSQLGRALRATKDAVPTQLRRQLGMNEGGTVVVLSIRGGRVQSVSAETLFQGRCNWLGHKWELAEKMPHYGMPPRTYAVGAAHLTMLAGGLFGGEMIENFFTPRASEEEVDAARKFNTACLTGNCNGLCDVAPRALKYLKQHPDAAWNIIPPKCE